MKTSDKTKIRNCKESDLKKFIELRKENIDFYNKLGFNIIHYGMEKKIK